MHKNPDKVRAGKRSVELHGNPATPEGRSRGGRAAISLMSREDKVRGGKAGSREDKVRAGRSGNREGKARGGRAGSHEGKVRAGQAGSRKQKADAGLKSFEMHGNPSTPEGCEKGGRHASHIVQHFRRGVFNLRCSYCLLELESEKNWGIPVLDESNLEIEEVL